MDFSNLFDWRLPLQLLSLEIITAATLHNFHPFEVSIFYPHQPLGYACSALRGDCISHFIIFY
uniref:Uncharacterized protein n=1 Tax=Octopus bimaculoides TaxID=37653 RepID=A0A0L8GIA1_OCTBM